MKNKIKSRKTVTRRFNTTSTGKVMHESTGQNHLMRKKSSKRQRTLADGSELYPGCRKRITRMLGFGYSAGKATPRKPVVEAAVVPEVC